MDSLVDSMENIHHGFGRRMWYITRDPETKPASKSYPENLIRLVQMRTFFFGDYLFFRGENLRFILKKKVCKIYVWVSGWVA